MESLGLVALHPQDILAIAGVLLFWVVLSGWTRRRRRRHASRDRGRPGD